MVIPMEKAKGAPINHAIWTTTDVAVGIYGFLQILISSCQFLHTESYASKVYFKTHHFFSLNIKKLWQLIFPYCSIMTNKCEMHVYRAHVIAFGHMQMTCKSYILNEFVYHSWILIQGPHFLNSVYILTCIQMSSTLENNLINSGLAMQLEEASGSYKI